MIKLTTCRHTILIIGMLLSLTFTGKMGAQNARPEVDILDGILTGMSDPIGFDNLISAMEGETQAAGIKETGIDFDLLSNSMDSDWSLFSGIEEAMTVNNALDFLTNAYTSPSQGYLNLYSNEQRPGIAPVFKGLAMLPVTGLITSGYGYRATFKRMHKGVDIHLQVGDTVRSALDGTISRVDYETKGYGLFVVIKHSDGLETRYAHLSRALVVPGMHVMAGEAIALGGNTGNSTGPHLHFETRRYGTAFDPTTIFDFSMPKGMSTNRNLAALDRENPKNSFMATDEMKGKTTYVVKPGDSLATVAERAGVSILTLCRLNMLSTTVPILPGRMLRLK